MGRSTEFHKGYHSGDDRWYSHYSNAVERLYPDAVHHLTGKQLRPLTDEEDSKAVSEANASHAEDEGD